MMTTSSGVVNLLTKKTKVMKTLKDFLNNYSSNKELHKKVWSAGGVDWNDFKERPYDYQDPSSGSVVGLIYYDDTVKFAKNNLGVILERLREVENEVGKLSVPNKKDEPIAYYNWLAWFAWEDMASELLFYIEE